MNRCPLRLLLLSGTLLLSSRSPAQAAKCIQAQVLRDDAVLLQTGFGAADEATPAEIWQK